MSAGWLALISLLGLVIGSFVNVVAYRVPLGRSIVHPPSACPHCGQPILPRDNIPVLGWVLLGGRCRDCRTPISPRYPLVEVATGILFGLFAAHLGPVWVLPAYFWFCAVTMVLLLTDIDVHRIPNSIVLPGVIVGAVLLVAGSLADGTGEGLVRAAAGGVAFSGGLLLLGLASGGGMGMGDVKLALILGMFTAYLSWLTLIASVLFAFLIGGVTAVAMLVVGRKGRKDRIAFAPSLVVGSWLATLGAWDLVIQF